ncbi:NAD-dependent epimerase/dehydratase family protein [Balneolales bacterium ANBcel1]|nr:NAD-dependent epimerase/dehydratase family protein [Balneolales bacterium ANBcel1]
MTYQRISILGCGWLGLPLACKLIENGDFVRGSTTTKEKIPLLEEAGIEPFYLRLDPHISGDDVTSFFDVDTVVLNITPPRVTDRTTYMLRQGEELISYLNSSPVKRLVMVSSTSVYGSKGQDADESDPHPPDTPNGIGLAAMEQQLMEGLQASVTVIRMAGLIGPGRHPGRFLAGRDVEGNGEEPVNLIHQDDAIGTVISVINKTGISGTYNACGREHPSRKELYEKASLILGFEPPRFTGNTPKAWKRVISEKLREHTEYRYVFDNPLDALNHMQ